MEFQTEPLAGLSLSDDAFQADLPLRHKEMNMNQVTFEFSSRGFDEETGEAEVANMRDVAGAAALPVDPHIRCGQ